MATLNIGQNRTKRLQNLTFNPNYEELKKKLKTKTVVKFQALYCLYREYFFYKIY